MVMMILSIYDGWTCFHVSIKSIVDKYVNNYFLDSRSKDHGRGMSK